MTSIVLKILGVNAENTRHIFLSVKLNEKAYYTENLPSMYDNLWKSVSKYESHPWIFATARPDFVQAGCQNLSDTAFDLQGRSRSNPVAQVNSPYMTSY